MFNLPVSSVPPLLAGGAQLSVTLLLVMFVTCTFFGLDGGAESYSILSMKGEEGLALKSVEHSFDSLLLITIFVGGNMPSKAYMLFSVSFVISKQQLRRKHCFKQGF